MHLFIIPLLVMIVAQAIKVVISITKGTFTWNLLNSYGGMPSSHAALATSLSYVLGYYEGLTSPAFAVSLILFVVIIRDAMGFRYQIGVHGTMINRLIKELPDRKEYQYPVLSQKLGHTPTEVAVGFLVGVASTALLIQLF